jgi:hypothetical protein
MTRREVLQVGTLGLAGLALPELLSVRARAARGGSGVKDTSVVLLFLTGGASQIETFDPKMDAPADCHSVTGQTATPLAGVSFGGTFPLLARRARRLAVVRSFSHNVSDHTKAVEHVIRGGNRAEAGMGAAVARLRGTTHPDTRIPSHVHVNAAEIDPQFHKEKMRLLTADGPGHLGGLYVPFQPSGDGQVNRDMRLNISLERLGERRSLQRAFDRLSRYLDDGAALNNFEQQAYDLILGGARAAFDLSREDRRVVERYDTSRFQTGLRAYRSSSLGRQLLLARRLCEAGCGFVTIHNPGWDMHGGDTQLDMRRGMSELGTPVDHAVSAFLDDVEQRGLGERILLVITSEFGRTPRLKNNGGRDHWPQLSTLALAGGGLKMGQVVGRSSARAEAPASSPITPENLLATVLHVLVDVPALRLLRALPRGLAAAIDQPPIAELL